MEVCKGLEELDLYPIFTDTCIFISKDYKLIISLYIDNIIILTDNIQVIRDFKAGITKYWEIKDLGEIKKIIGLEITRDRTKWIIKIIQIVYTNEMIMEYSLMDICEVRILSVNLEILESISEKDKLTNINYYRKVISKLLFLIYNSQLNIYFIIL